VDDVPGAMVPFQGRLLVGIGKALRIFDLGKKKLLRKCETKVFFYILSPSCFRSSYTDSLMRLLSQKKKKGDAEPHRHAAHPG
jgi:hypothetical protein